MKISTQTGHYLTHDFSWEEMVKCVTDAGFDYVDFSFSVLKKAVWPEEGWNKEDFQKLREYADSCNIAFNQVYAPGITNFTVRLFLTVKSIRSRWRLRICGRRINFGTIL